LFLFAVAAMAATPVLQAQEPSVADLVRAATSGAEAARVKALNQLAQRGEKAAEAVPALTKLLSDGSPAIRAHAAHALGGIGAPAKSAASALTSLLKDDDALVRRQAVKALVAIKPGPQVMIPLVTKLLDDSDPGVRLRILNAAAEAGASAVPGLIEALKDEKAAYWACLVLREIGPEAKAAVPALAAKLKDADPEIRREAALTLGAMQEAAVPVLSQLEAALDDEHGRIAATYALGQIGSLSDAAEVKIEANSRSDDKFLSTVSLWTLARIHPDDKELRRKATEKLVDRMMDKDPLVRVAAARAMAALPPAPDIVLPIWEKALANADETTVHHAMDALAALGKPAVPRLIDALKHEKLRPQVAHILGHIGPDAAPAAEALAKVAASQDARAASEAALALAKIGPAAKAAVPQLSAALAKPDCACPHAIAYALGSIGADAAAAEPALLATLKSDDRSLAVMGAWALTKVKPADAVAKAVPVLIAGLGDAHPQTRRVAAEALGELGPQAKSAAAALEKASADQDPAVRAAAAEALRAVRGAGR
jgi:HEAT repeat protein